MANQHQSKPKEFSLHWGSGIVEEEVQITTEHHRPTIQLLKFLDGEATGSYEIRFCHYDHRGRFHRSPLILDVDNLQDLGKEVSNSPKLREFLARLTTE